MPNRRLIETDKLYRRPIDLLHRWLPCLIGNPPEIDMPKTSLMGLHMHVGFCWVSNQACWSPIRPFGLQSVLLVTHKACWSPIRHVGLRWVSNKVCCLQSGLLVSIRPVGHRLGSLVSDGSKTKHVGLQSGLLVFNQTFWSPIMHVSHRGQILRHQVKQI